MAEQKLVIVQLDAVQLNGTTVSVSTKSLRALEIYAEHWPGEVIVAVDRHRAVAHVGALLDVDVRAPRELELERLAVERRDGLEALRHHDAIAAPLRRRVGAEVPRLDDERVALPPRAGVTQVLLQPAAEVLFVRTSSVSLRHTCADTAKAANQTPLKSC